MINDPVLNCLEKNKPENCQLNSHIAIDFDFGTSIFRSNSEELISRIKDKFNHYNASENFEEKEAQYIFDVFFIEKTDRNRDFKLFYNQSKGKKKQEHQKEKGDLEYHKQSGFEVFYKPNTLLVSHLDSDLKNFRILSDNIHIDYDQAGQHDPIAKRNALSTAFDEVTDLLKVLIINFQGLFCIHGAVLAEQDCGILITAPSGVGKTTTALTALKGGFSLLTDELALLDVSSTPSPQLSGLLIPISINGEISTDFGKLSEIISDDSKESYSNIMDPVVSDPTDKVRIKQGFSLPVTFIERARNRSVTPAVILFLKRDKGTVQSETHKLDKISSQFAFIKLMEQILDINSSYRMEERTEAIIKLIDSCSIYELTLGSDLSSLPSLIRSCLLVK